MAREVGLSLVSSGLSGGLACAALNPLDTLKVRYQVSPGAQGMRAFAGEIIRREGLVGGLWAPGILANSVGIGISSMGRVGAYPYVRDALVGAYGGGERAPKAIMFLAGLVAGGVGYWASSPVYQVKTLAQAEAGLVSEGILETGSRAGRPPAYHTRPLSASLASLARDRALFRGSGALVVRGALLSAGQTTGYDGVKTEARAASLPDGPALHVLASVAGALGAAVFSTPADYVMTRYQNSRDFSSVFDCARHILATEGPLAFTAASPPSSSASAPSSSLAFLSPSSSAGSAASATSDPCPVPLPKFAYLHPGSAAPSRRPPVSLPPLYSPPSLPSPFFMSIAYAG
eukprot:CAMPEP_0197387708 /NCGR_PEP_ID=MMETSP1165-20131217/682_1 /TAXON_ID=284809 /ORGANISM="Chrysocystis fragilis, Strain CCMP3189" /LENGTH=345 /DNA_ID=CAMNT_0042913041 /DNA_START=28 /DNA_END=1062 /DNA_ORIENTATION=-